MKVRTIIQVCIAAFAMMSGIYALREGFRHKELRALLFCVGLLMIASGGAFLWAALVK
jgi:hypothetical protein